MKKKIAACIALLLCTFLQGTQKRFTFSDEKAWGMKNTTISCCTEEAKIGSIECLQLPCSFYVLHSFYVYPDYRNQGIGKALLARACMFLKNQRAYKTYLQPGPFELDGDALVEITDKQEYQIKMKRLVALYRSVGFQPVYAFNAAVIGIFYKIFQMSEDARYLMVL